MPWSLVSECSPIGSARSKVTMKGKGRGDKRKKTFWQRATYRWSQFTHSLITVAIKLAMYRRTRAELMVAQTGNTVKTVVYNRSMY